MDLPLLLSANRKCLQIEHLGFLVTSTFSEVIGRLIEEMRCLPKRETELIDQRCADLCLWKQSLTAVPHSYLNPSWEHAVHGTYDTLCPHRLFVFMYLVFQDDLDKSVQTEHPGIEIVTNE